MDWLSPETLALVAALAAALLAVAKVAVKFSKTDKDDKVVDAVSQVVDPLLPGDQSSKPKE